MGDDQLVLLGKILSPHGVKGQVKVWAYTEVPYNIISYGPLRDGARTFTLNLQGQTPGGVIASIDGVTNRNDAERLKGVELYVLRSALPNPDDGQFYQNDLLGSDVTTEAGEVFGVVAAFHNFGAGTIIEIRLKDSQKSELFAFTAANFPSIDAKAKRLTIHPPEEIIAGEKE